MKKEINLKPKSPARFNYDNEQSDHSRLVDLRESKISNQLFDHATSPAKSFTNENVMSSATKSHRKSKSQLKAGAYFMAGQATEERAHARRERALSKEMERS